MRVETEHGAVARAHRLEQAVGEREAAIERGEQRLIRRALDAIQPEHHRNELHAAALSDSRDARRGANARSARSGSGDVARAIAVQEAVDQPIAVLGERGLRVELHADDRMRAMLRPP